MSIQRFANNAYQFFIRKSNRLASDENAKEVTEKIAKEATEKIAKEATELLAKEYTIVTDPNFMINREYYRLVNGEMVNLGFFIGKESNLEGYGTDMASVTRGNFNNSKNLVISDSGKESNNVIFYTKNESPTDTEVGGSRRKNQKKSRKNKSSKKVKIQKKTRRR